MTASPATLVAQLPEIERRDFIARLTQEQARRLRYHWRGWLARPEQLSPEASQAGLSDWRYWLLLAGRGFGKSRSGAEWIRERVESGFKRIALVGRSAADVRDTMVRDGILSIFPPEERPVYEPSKRRVTFRNGAIATCYSADKPDQLRGPQHDTFWADELAAWRYPDAWDQLQLGLRLGSDPKGVVTTTPRPTRMIRDLVNDKRRVALTRGSTYDNLPNLADAYIETVVSKYEGTTLGQQELYAVVLDEMPGALWKRSMITAGRIQTEQLPPLRNLIVALDPSTTAEGNECGIVAGGLGPNRHGYLIKDESVRASPEVWGRRAVQLYTALKADAIVAEDNQGGEMVEFVLKTIDSRVPVRRVHATRGKRTRAEPIVSLYEQGRIHHVGVFPDLEDQLCSWDPSTGEESPDRLDATVWLFTELLVNQVSIGSMRKSENLDQEGWNLT